MDSNVRAYLATAGAVQALSIDRLRHMNPFAIELYRRYKVEIATAALKFAGNRLAEPKPTNILRAVTKIKAPLRKGSPLDGQTVRDTVQARMREHAGTICTPENVPYALAQARGSEAVLAALNANITSRAATGVWKAFGFNTGKPRK